MEKWDETKNKWSHTTYHYGVSKLTFSHIKHVELKTNQIKSKETDDGASFNELQSC